MLGYQEDSIVFDSLSGPLKVIINETDLTLDFPAASYKNCETPSELINGIGVTPEQCYESNIYIAVLKSEEDMANLQINVQALKKLDLSGVVVTVASKEYDFVSRFFAPKNGIIEDPVTGSSFTKLAPLWANKLNKTRLNAKQVSKRGGEVKCELKGDRVWISGNAVTFLEAEIVI